MERNKERSRQELIDEVKAYMHNEYQNAAPDLPRHGHYHFASAVEWCVGRAYDKFFGINKQPPFSLRRAAEKVVREYAPNDTRHSNKRDRIIYGVTPKKKEVRQKRWDEIPPHKSRLGISSY